MVTLQGNEFVTHGNVVRTKRNGVESAWQNTQLTNECVFLPSLPPLTLPLPHLFWEASSKDNAAWWRDKEPEVRLNSLGLYSTLTSHHALLAGSSVGRLGTRYSTFLPSTQHRQFLRPVSPSLFCIPTLDWNHRTEKERARVQAYSLQCACAEIQVSFVLFKKNELCSFCTEAEFPSRTMFSLTLMMSCASEKS